MKMIALIILFIFAFICKFEAAKNMGPVGNFNINSLYECPENEKPPGDEAVWSFKIAPSKAGTKISGSLALKIPLDDKINYTLVLKRWENSSWKKYHEMTGHPCADITKFLPKLWSKVVGNIKPDPGRACPVKADTYNIEDMHASSKDLDIKSIFYGRLLLHVTAIDKDKKPIFCAMAEADSQASAA